MTTPARAISLWRLCRQTIKEGIPGDFAECGVWMGGSAGIMGLAMKSFKNDSSRKLHLFDSFEGLPEPSDHDGKKAAEYWENDPGDVRVSAVRCLADVDVVREFLIGYLKLPATTTIIHKGWFDQTIPNAVAGIDRISLLRLDGDWYESTKICLELLYDKIAPGGILILDDYRAWDGCKKATDEFRAARSIKDEIISIDEESVYWRKSK